MCYMKPYIVVFGGNTVSQPTNEVWIIPLEKSPFSWAKLELPEDTLPSPRLYHASGICTKGNAQGMMIVFGGRDQSENALNDTWGLRRHRDGRWDWVVAPYKGEITPKNRYNVKKINKIFNFLIASYGLLGELYDNNRRKNKKHPRKSYYRSI